MKKCSHPQDRWWGQHHLHCYHSSFWGKTILLCHGKFTKRPFTGKTYFDPLSQELMLQQFARPLSQRFSLRKTEVLLNVKHIQDLMCFSCKGTAIFSSLQSLLCPCRSKGPEMDSETLCSPVPLVRERRNSFHSGTSSSYTASLGQFTYSNRCTEYG